MWFYAWRNASKNFNGWLSIFSLEFINSASSLCFTFGNLNSMVETEILSRYRANCFRFIICFEMFFREAFCLRRFLWARFYCIKAAVQLLKAMLRKPTNVKILAILRQIKPSHKNPPIFGFDSNSQIQHLYNHETKIFVE